MPSDDIVTRLLRPLNVLAFNDLTEEAAEEINRLRELVSKADELRSERDEARRERDEARRERDEARRMYCEAVILHGTAHRLDANGVPEEITDAKDFARTLHWDCYREAP